MHDAFQVTTVVDKVSRIESIFAHGKSILPKIASHSRPYLWNTNWILLLFFYLGDRLLIGTGVGHLLEYDIKEPLGRKKEKEKGTS